MAAALQADDSSSSLHEPLLEASSCDADTGVTTSVVEPHDETLRNTGSQSHSPSDDDAWKNTNVRLSLWLVAFQGVADSVWGSVVLSGFLFALGKAMGKSRQDNTLVGAAEAVQGMTQLISALPVGYVADVYGKSRIVAYGGALMLMTIAVTLWALQSAERHASQSTHQARHSYLWILVALGLWGIVGGIANGPSQALFADSVRKGKRSELLTWLYSIYLVASAVGPTMSIVLLLTLSTNAEDWSMHQIYPVFCVGILLEIPGAILMFFFSDKHVIVEEEEATRNQVTREPSSEVDDAHEVETVDARNELDENAISQPTVDSFGKKAIPYVLFVSSLIVSLGSGASVKYFPLFFKELGLSNVAVQTIFLAVPVSIAALSFIAQRVSLKLGRIETIVLFGVVGTSLLFFMTWLSRDEDHLTQASRGLIVAVYLLRTGIMNSTYPLLESILMDNVPSNQRARWKSLESIAAFGWTGSALVGGILADERSYRFTFSITAAMQLCGGMMLVPLQPYVESEVSQQEQKVDQIEGDVDEQLCLPLFQVDEESFHTVSEDHRSTTRTE